MVIIGGSHSGFSCAWLMLHGPAMYQRCLKTLAQPNSGAPSKVPFATRKSVKNCVDCCTCGNALAIASRNLAAKRDNGGPANAAN